MSQPDILKAKIIILLLVICVSLTIAIFWSEPLPRLQPGDSYVENPEWCKRVFFVYNPTGYLEVYCTGDSGIRRNRMLKIASFAEVPESR